MVILLGKCRIYINADKEKKMRLNIHNWAAIVLISLITFPVNAATILTGDVWDVTGSDRLYTWEGSTLVFTSQVQIPSTSDFSIEGYFDWIGSGGQSGRELFRGTYYADDTMLFSGYQNIDPVGIILGNYAARVSTDGNTIIGDWDSGTVPGSGLPGDFMAVRNPVVPVPAAIWLFGSGLLGLIGFTRARKPLKNS